MADWYGKRNDRQPAISATLKDASGAAVNLTGATVRFKLRSRGASAAKVDAAATITNAAGGQVRYAWAAGDLDTAGLFDAEFEVTFGDGTTETFPNDRHLVVQVTEDL